ncbi:succinate--CoA ligase subunit alpha [Chromatiales bacterium (ex Bugula neritina AB1)]|nr:succinate--CoA ligase subunit alpha [Chromatiales bacterium (ex Bugula neritina AB1)]
MSILISASTRVIAVGMTGRVGSFHCQRMLDYGTRIVAGVTPGKGGQKVNGLPVFNTIKEAACATEAVTAMIMVPAPFAADSIMEAAEAGIRLCVAITDGIPAQDMIRVKRYMKRYRESESMRLVGPNCAGVISPGESMVGIMPSAIYEPGRVGIISRSGTLGYEAAAQLKDLSLGVSTSVGIGGDQITGSSFLDYLKLFSEDADTDAVVLLGEIGGPQEALAADFLRKGFCKPVVAYVAGSAAPKGQNLGHAGAIITAFGDGADEKSHMLSDVGVTIAEDPSFIGTTVQQVLQAQE